jgi:hypothetical protein
VDAMLVSLVLYVEIIACSNRKINRYLPSGKLKPGEKPASLPRLQPHRLWRAIFGHDC